MLAAVGLISPSPAAAGCGSWYNPVCWVSAGLDYAWDTVKGVLALTWDVVTLKPEDALEDVQDLLVNQLCGPKLSLLSLAVANGLEHDFDQCAKPPHSIEPAILSELQRYIKSPLGSVRIHEGCNLDADSIPGNEAPRKAITFGEHIYFAPGEYYPQDAVGFALLAHEITHVLQYRKEGVADFACQYAITCALGLKQSCALEQSAYAYEALVLDDQLKDSDGDFSPVDNCPKAFNPNQRDSDGDGHGNACDPGKQCTQGQTKHQACPLHHVGSGYESTCDHGWWVVSSGWCAYQPPQGGGGTKPPLEP